MSDKLKIMQNRITTQLAVEADLCSSASGYPDLRTLPSKEGHANWHEGDQPEADESAFERLVQAAEESKLIVLTA